MTIKIVEKKEAPLLSRTEIIAELDFDKETPSKKTLKEKLVPVLSAKENLLVVKKVFQKFGSKKARVLAYIYDNEKDMQHIEPKEKGKKKKEKAKKEEAKE